MSKSSCKESAEKTRSCEGKRKSKAMEWGLEVERKSENALDLADRISHRHSAGVQAHSCTQPLPIRDAYFLANRAKPRCCLHSTLFIPSFLDSLEPQNRRLTFHLVFYRSFTLSFYMILSKLPEWVSKIRHSREKLSKNAKAKIVADRLSREILHETRTENILKSRS